jgi:hypothetical protein
MWKALSEHTIEKSNSLKSINDVPAEFKDGNQSNNSKSTKADLKNIRRKSLIKKSNTVGFKINPIKAINKIGKFLSKQVNSQM